MRRKGRNILIRPKEEERRLSNRELQAKYGISRVTAWRFRTGKINHFYTVAEKKSLQLQINNSALEQLITELQFHYEKLYKRDVNDCIQEALTRIHEYYYEIDSWETYRRYAFWLTKKLIQTELKKRRS